VHQLKLDSGEGSRMAWLHARGEVLDQRHDGDNIHVAVKLSTENWERFQRL
jgi:GTP-binding protein HflX